MEKNETLNSQDLRKSNEAAFYGEWISVETRMPEYYETIWASDGRVVVLSRMVGRSHTPRKQIFKNLERYGCDELCGIIFWQPCFRPVAP